MELIIIIFLSHYTMGGGGGGALLQSYTYETIHIHSNGRGHFVTTASIGGKVKIFDSLNLSPSPELMKQICTLYSPDPKITPTTLKAEIRSIQSGYTDCGFFAIAYTVEICSWI